MTGKTQRARAIRSTSGLAASMLTAAVAGAYLPLLGGEPAGGLSLVVGALAGAGLAVAAAVVIGPRLPRGFAYGLLVIGGLAIGWIAPAFAAFLSRSAGSGPLPWQGVLAYFVTMAAVAAAGSTHPDPRVRLAALVEAAVGLGIAGYLAALSVGLPLLIASVLAGAGAIRARHNIT
jgi:hypothetical protein